MTNRQFRIFAGAALTCFVLQTPAGAKSYKELFPEHPSESEKVQKILDALDFQQGAIKLPSAHATLNVNSDYYYLSPADTKRVLVELWGNPPGTAENLLGMLFPAKRTPNDDTWGATISFLDDGYVSDEDAAKYDYTALLKDMQTDTADSNPERVKQGFGSIKLIGWAAPPFYDKAEHKLHWAKELEFDGSPSHTLNYDLRALGRQGVLKMSFVAGLDKLAEVKEAIPSVLAIPSYDKGSTYADYVPGVDKIAAYGIGGLIAGKIAAKTGLLVLALVFLKKGWIIVLLALGGGWRLLKWILGGRRQPPPAGPPPAGPPPTGPPDGPAETGV